MKLGRLFVVTLILALCVTIPKAHANVVEFEISANYVWASAKNWQSSINDTNKYSGVGWTGSSRSSHKMWFGVQNSRGKQVGKLLFNYKTTDAFKTEGLEKNETAYLEARRENLLDPMTTVSGTWTA